MTADPLANKNNIQIVILVRNRLSAVARQLRPKRGAGHLSIGRDVTRHTIPTIAYLTIPLRLERNENERYGTEEKSTRSSTRRGFLFLQPAPLARR